jgi:hypothetical protein
VSKPGAARTIKRIYEPDENLTHHVGPSIIGNATLCGVTDFIHAKGKGRPTRKPVDCQGCLGIVAFVLTNGASG